MAELDTTGTETTATPAEATGTPTPAEPSNPTPPAADPAPPAATDPAPAADPAETPDPLDTDEPAVKETDWAAVRTRIAKGDEKLEKRLARYSSIDSVVEALIAAQNKIASGGLKTAYPKEGSEAEIAAWRAENGVPETADGYEIKLDEGVLMGDEDKPLVSEFLQAAHAANYTPEQANAAVNWYMNMREQEADAIAANDTQSREQAEQQISEMWGTETKLNKQMILNHLKGAPDGVGDLLLGGRLADGTPIFNHPGALRWFAEQARSLNPIATVVPGSGQNAAQAMEDEIASIEKMMGDRESDYWKGPKAATTQERYRKLIDAKQRLGGM